VSKNHKRHKPNAQPDRARGTIRCERCGAVADQRGKYYLAIIDHEPDCMLSIEYAWANSRGFRP
jgi:hypothetical protein